MLVEKLVSSKERKVTRDFGVFVFFCCFGFLNVEAKLTKREGILGIK